MKPFSYWAKFKVPKKTWMQKLREYMERNSELYDFDPTPEQIKESRKYHKRFWRDMKKVVKIKK